MSKSHGSWSGGKFAASRSWNGGIFPRRSLTTSSTPRPGTMVRQSCLSAVATSGGRGVTSPPRIGHRRSKACMPVLKAASCASRWAEEAQRKMRKRRVKWNIWRASMGGRSTWKDGLGMKTASSLNDEWAILEYRDRDNEMNLGLPANLPCSRRENIGDEPPQPHRFLSSGRRG